MKQLVAVVMGLALLAGLGTLWNAVRADEKEPTIKEIMTKAHKGGDSLIEHLKKAVKEKEPEWAAIQKDSKSLVDLGKALGKATPPKGEQASWEKLTKTYSDNATALAKAADDKDGKAAAAAVGKLATSCGACHSQHKPK